MLLKTTVLGTVTSVKVTDYTLAGYQADFFTQANCGGEPNAGTYGQLNNCEQGNSAFKSVFVRCPPS